MKLTMKPVGWESDGPSKFNPEEVNQYRVQSFPGNDQVFILATTTGRARTWAIIQNGKSRGEYATAEAALEVLETELT